MGRVETAIEETRAEQAEQSRTTQFLLATVLKNLNHSSLEPQPLEVSSHSENLSCTFRYPIKAREQDCFTDNTPVEKVSRMTRRKPNAVSTPVAGHGVQILSQKSNARCLDWCSCSCHKKTTVRVKDPKTIGSFSLAYGGLPWLTANCDQKSCRSRSVPSVAVTFQFPPWIWKRYLSGAISYKSIQGFDQFFKTPRVVDWSSKIWGYGIAGDIKGIQEAFSAGTASALDVSPLGGNLLHYATGRRHWDLCALLIQEGALTESEDDFQNSPSAIIWENILSGNFTGDDASRAASLFRNTDFLETRSFTMLHKMVLGLVPRTISSELEYSTKDLDTVDASRRTCVFWATARGDDETLRTLLGYSADVNIRDGQGSLPLHHASNIECIDLLLEFGADPNARDAFGHTPAHMICRGSGSLDLLHRLVKAGTNVDAVDDSGETALMNAIFNKHTRCAFYLLENNARTDLANGSGDTAIHMAMMQDMHDVVHQLLHSGADYTCMNRAGSTVLHVAAQYASSKTIDVLRQHGLDGIDAQRLDVDNRVPIDYMRERQKDDQNTNLMGSFEELLHSVNNAKSSENKQNVDSTATNMATNPRANLKTLKDAVFTSCTPVSSEEEERDEESGNEDFGRESLVFFDAVEDTSEMLSVMEISV